MKNDFAAIAEKVANEQVKRSNSEPELKQCVLEKFACVMAQVGYDLTPNTVEIMSDYLKGYNLLICGLVGVGKTYFFDCINRIRKSRGFGPIIKLSMIDTQGWDMDTARDWIFSHKGEDLLIDDVGTEPKMKSWGQEAELFPYLLEKRMQLTNRRTHLTTNMSMDEMKARYGLRVRDRFDQMFKIEVITSRKSKRKQSLRPWLIADNGQGTI